MVQLLKNKYPEQTSDVSTLDAIETKLGEQVEGYRTIREKMDSFSQR